MKTCSKTSLQTTSILFRYSSIKAGSIWRKRHNFDASLDRMLLLKTSQVESHGTSWSGRWRTHLLGRFTWLTWRKNCRCKKRNGSTEKRNALRLRRRKLRLQDLKKRLNVRGVLNAARRLWLYIRMSLTVSRKRKKSKPHRSRRSSACQFKSRLKCYRNFTCPLSNQQAGRTTAHPTVQLFCILQVLRNRLAQALSQDILKDQQLRTQQLKNHKCSLELSKRTSR